jgi:hypothetical protein
MAEKVIDHSYAIQKAGPSGSRELVLGRLFGYKRLLEGVWSKASSNSASICRVDGQGARVGDDLKRKVRERISYVDVQGNVLERIEATALMMARLLEFGREYFSVGRALLPSRIWVYNNKLFEEEAEKIGLFRRSSGFYNTKDYSISLLEGDEAVALAHENGHFIHHIGMIDNISRGKRVHPYQLSDAYEEGFANFFDLAFRSSSSVSLVPLGRRVHDALVREFYACYYVLPGKCKAIFDDKEVQGQLKAATSEGIVGGKAWGIMLRRIDAESDPEMHYKLSSVAGMSLISNQLALDGYDLRKTARKLMRRDAA